MESEKFLELSPADQTKELSHINEHAMSSHGQQVLSIIIELLRDCPRCLIPATKYLIENPKLGFSRIKAISLYLDESLLAVFLALVDDSQPLLRALNQSFQNASGPTEKKEVMVKLASLLRTSSLKEFKIMVRGNLLIDFLNNAGDYIKELFDRLDAPRYKIILKRLIQDFTIHLSIISKLLKFVPTMEPQKIKYTQQLFRQVDTSSNHNLALQIEIISRINVLLPIKLKVGDTVSMKGRANLLTIVAMKIVSDKNKAGKRVTSTDWDTLHSVANNVVVVLDDGTITRGNNLRP